MARDLLGKKLILRIGVPVGGVVVETEAYFGEEDPASRAARGKQNHNRPMWSEPGTVFVYNVHKYWMLNAVAHEPGKVGGVLFRALEPTVGVDEMLRRRPVKRITELCSGPGKLSLALGVERTLTGERFTNPEGPAVIYYAPSCEPVGTSLRIGVTRDLPNHYRFYLRGNPHVSR